MYNLIDQPTDRLCRGSHFLLWAMRGWIYAMEKQKCPPAALGPGFSCAGLLTILPAFNQVMGLLNRSSLENVAVAPMPCQHIAEDEAILLTLWRDMAVGDVETVRGTLTLLVEEDSIEPLYQAMKDVIPRMVTNKLTPYGLAMAQKHKGTPDIAPDTFSGSEGEA